MMNYIATIITQLLTGLNPNNLYMEESLVWRNTFIDVQGYLYCGLVIVGIIVIVILIEKYFNGKGIKRIEAQSFPFSFSRLKHAHLQERRSNYDQKRFIKYRR